uniref:non-specific serine/threonine protein kinase n=1 Tax=Sedum alfredii TaxID=439688 RepID=A0A410N695_9MAGN|nr:LRR receptor-like kinase family protein [Sedum alfredii]
MLKILKNFIVILIFATSLNTLYLCCFSLDEQGRALLEWRNGLNVSGDALKSWSSLDQNPCNWFGIRCDSNGDVVDLSLKLIDLRGSVPSNFQALKFLTTLVLSSTNLTGSIPKQIGDYQELTVIDLSDNSLTGEIPSEICGLSKLETLALNTNSLENGIPENIGNLTNLVYLTLYDNQLSGRIPKSIGNLAKLETFRAGGNQNLKGEVPWEIGNCSNLVILGLAETSVSGSLPTTIGKLKRLQTIAVYTTLLSGPVPDEIGECTELRNLYLYQNSITGAIPETIGQLKKLQSVLLWQNSLVGVIPMELGNCTELTVIDFSENQLTGNIPRSIGKLKKLQELQLSINSLSGNIPAEISDCTSLTHLEIDNNEITGEIPSQIGNLKEMTLFFAWKNKLAGRLPEKLADCQNLQALDLSFNSFIGPIPKQIFNLQNLTKLLLLSNEFSGFIPPDIGNCTNLYRLRINDNRFGGTIPAEIGNLKNLNFVDFSKNRLVGEIPVTISGCRAMEFLDLHGNGITGSFPESLPKSLQFVDVSENRLTGPLTSSIGTLSELNKMILRENRLSGRVPPEILACSKLQLLDLGENEFFGEIPKELGLIPSLEIALNLSCNQFSGEIPSQFSGLTKLALLDLSHNQLSGELNVLQSLQNLVSLNISFNAFSGELPNTPFFRKLPLSDLAGNRDLYMANGIHTSAEGSDRKTKSRMRLTMSILVSVSAVLVLLGVYMLVRGRMMSNKLLEENVWELTLYQKMEFSIDEVVRNLTTANVIGTGSSGIVYKTHSLSREALAVKKMWASDESGAFSSEINTLGSIRHKNIVRLLGWGSNQNLKLLFYDYLPNGSLSSLLHGAGKGSAEWETRYDVLLGVAHALAYLHHDCLPAIIHGDVKAMNVLLGTRNEPYLADFGLARTVPNNVIDHFYKGSHKPRLAGSYGYMAPEHASMQLITEKSDVYSFGVVLLEVLTGRHPLDPTMPGGAHLVQWVKDHLASKQEPGDILDTKLRGRSDPQMHEMLQTLAVSFLCISNRPDDRPTMKDVVAMLKEIRHVESSRTDSEKLKDHSHSPPSPTIHSPLHTRKTTLVHGNSSNCSSSSFSDNSTSYKASH